VSFFDPRPGELPFAAASLLALFPEKKRIAVAYWKKLPERFKPI